MPLMSRENNLMLTWSTNCIISYDATAMASAMADTRLFVLVVALSMENNLKEFQ